MSASKLVKPATRYKESFLGAIKEFHKEDRYLFINPEDIAESFEGFVNDLNNGKRHMHQPFENWVEPVPETTLWFVKDEHFIGTLNIRHRLNWHLEKWGGHISFNIRPSMRGQGFGKKILQKALPCTCYLGIDRALITIDPAHKAAQHIVTLAGAKFEDETPKTDQFPPRRRYWINCN